METVGLTRLCQAVPPAGIPGTPAGGREREGDVISTRSLGQGDSTPLHGPDLQGVWGTQQMLGGTAQGCRGARWLGQRDGDIARNTE